MIGYTHEEPYDTGYLTVSNVHSVYYEEYGKKSGKPVVFIHGGPGGGSSIFDTRFFDPNVYRVILLDQRGAGKSKPTCELRENTTQDLIDDIETLRKHLRVDKWHLVFGGSWGSTLALLYAQAHPDRVASLVLRGIFLVRESELAWDNHGASQLFPEAYEMYLAPLPAENRQNPIAGHYKLLTSDNHDVRMQSARALEAWISTHLSLQESTPTPQDVDETALLNHCLLNIHYIHNRCFMEDGQILKKENMKKICHIPCTIIQGRYDIFCPPITAWELHKAWPGSKLIIIPNAGHIAAEPGIFEQLVKACDECGKSSLE